jgi:hypothetical protein
MAGEPQRREKQRSGVTAYRATILPCLHRQRNRRNRSRRQTPAGLEAGTAKAIAHYGFYLEDTGNNALNFRWEGENSYVPFGAEEPFTKIGEEQAIEKSGAHYLFNQSEGVKWKERLHAIEPPAH